VSLADLDGFAAAWADPEVVRYLPGGQPRTRERTEAGLRGFAREWDEHGFGVWSLLLRTSGAWVGYCGLRYLSESTDVELLYGLARAWWGKGLATETARAAARFGFDVLGLERIVALAVPDNRASIRVMEHLGMRFERAERAFDLDVLRYTADRPTTEPRSDGA
jgi:ribosomal-protein-alanine N-acetyltransferase